MKIYGTTLSLLTDAVYYFDLDFTTQKHNKYIFTLFHTAQMEISIINVRLFLTVYIKKSIKFNYKNKIKLL